MGVHRIAKPVFAGAVILLACSLWPVSAPAAAIPANETGTIRAVFGFRFPTVEVGDFTVTSGLEITSLGPKPLTVGHFGANGAVVDGDVVVKVFINLGTAPMDKIFLPATNGSTPIFVTPQVSRASGILNAEGFVIPPDFFAIEPEFFQWSAPAGSAGILLYGFAFLERADQPLSTALGVTVPYIVVIGGVPPGSNGEFLRAPDGDVSFTLPLTFGGAVFFAPVPSTLLLVGGGFIGIAVSGVFRTRRREDVPVYAPLTEGDNGVAILENV